MKPIFKITITGFLLVQLSVSSFTQTNLWYSTSDILLQGTSRDLFIRNTSETASGVIFQDYQDQTGQYSKILFDASGNSLRFYLKGYGSIPGSDDMMLSLHTDRKLRLSGTFIAQEILVQSNIWADYVFRNDYKLAPLSEVEQYIKENGSLPGIPKEEEVLEKGINVSEMNVLLLEKIEELTLHVIQLEKEINTLKSTK